MRTAIDEMPRLRAVECMEQVNVLQVGNGKMKRERARSVIAGWKRLARAGAWRRRARSEGEWRSALAASGIGITVVKGS